MMIVIHPVFIVDIAVYSVSVVITLVFTILTRYSPVKNMFCQLSKCVCLLYGYTHSYEYPYHTVLVL